MQASVCREQLDKLIAAETEVLARLEQLLGQEHEIIRNNDIDALDRAGDARQACIVELARIQDERRTLCRMLDMPTDPQGIERLLQWCDPSSHLQKSWAACADRARRCRDANERNGALVSARLKRVEGLLGAITGRPASNPLYSASGSTHNVRAGQLLATKV
ncbi:MAG TPA: flagellar protein FlgN [Steroidobacteraceae bacterium]|nr:flagellar protein FlgN [Steroidobacteraceae bacterium]